VAPDAPAILNGMLIPRVPEGSVTFILGVIGGVGGSVTVMSYGYWIRERGWRRKSDLAKMQIDLATGYLLTGLFGLAIMIVAAGIRPEEVAGSRMALAVANHLGEIAGPVGKWLFLTGFWGAVFSSMLGVWHGVPYIFSDFVHKWKKRQEEKPVGPKSLDYRIYLLYLALPPAVLVFMGRPVWVIIIYAVSGALFMPFLAATLLYMNNKTTWLGDKRNRWRTNIALIAALLLFAILFALELQRRLF
jgi:Mn2+/Fe2+ NRAMP family transporter